MSNALYYRYRVSSVPVVFLSIVIVVSGIFLVDIETPIQTYTESSGGWYRIARNSFGYNQGYIRMVDIASQFWNTLGPNSIFDDAQRMVMLLKDVHKLYAFSPRRCIFSGRSMDVSFSQLVFLWLGPPQHPGWFTWSILKYFLGFGWGRAKAADSLIMSNQ